MPPGQLVRAIRPDQDHLLVAQPSREVDEQSTRRWIGPVEVLEHEHDRSLERQAAQHIEHDFEEARARIDPVVGGPNGGCGRCVAEAGYKPREVNGAFSRCLDDPLTTDVSQQRPKRLAEGSVWQVAVAKPDRAADDDAETFGSSHRGGLGHEARLPDAGLSGDEDRRRFAGRCAVARGAEPVELDKAAGECRADDARRHRRHHRASLGRGQCGRRPVDHPDDVVAPTNISDGRTARSGCGAGTLHGRAGAGWCRSLPDRPEAAVRRVDGAAPSNRHRHSAPPLHR